MPSRGEKGMDEFEEPPLHHLSGLKKWVHEGKKFQGHRYQKGGGSEAEGFGVRGKGRGHTGLRRQGLVLGWGFRVRRSKVTS